MDRPWLAVPPDITAVADGIVIRGGQLSAIGECSVLGHLAPGVRFIECCNPCTSRSQDLQTFANVVFPVCGGRLARLYVVINASITAENEGRHLMPFLDACDRLPHLEEIMLDLWAQTDGDRFVSLMRQWAIRRSEPWLTSAIAKATQFPTVLQRIVVDLVISSPAIDDGWRDHIFQDIRLILRRCPAPVATEELFWTATVSVGRFDPPTSAAHQGSNEVLCGVPAC